MKLKDLLKEVETEGDKVLNGLSKAINEMRKIQFIVCYHHIFLYLKDTIENHTEKRFSLVVSLREDGYGHYLHSKLLEGQEEYEYTSPLVTEDFANDIFCTVDKIYVTNLNFFGLIKEEGEVYLDFGEPVQEKFEKYILSEECQSLYRAALLDGSLSKKEDSTTKKTKI